LYGLFLVTVAKLAEDAFGKALEKHNENERHDQETTNKTSKKIRNTY